MSLTPQVNRLSSNVPSSLGRVSFAPNINMTVRKQDYTNAIHNIKIQVLSRMLINSRNIKKNIANSTLGIQSTNVAVETAVETALETVQSTVSVSGTADPITGELDLLDWPGLY
jgi:hypothetical protein